MADTKISALDALGAVPASGDLFVIVDVSDTSMGAGGTNKYLTANRVAYVGSAQTFTTSQGITPATDVNGLTVTMASGNTKNALLCYYDVDLRMAATFQSDESCLSLRNIDNGANEGPYLYLYRNTNTSTPSAGFIRMKSGNNQDYRIWPDATGLLRISGSADPTNALDTGGTVIGAQSSNLASKVITGGAITPAEALRSIGNAAMSAVHRFRYVNGEYHAEEFDGLVTDYAPRYGMDRDAAHPGGKVLNLPTLFGDIVQAIAELKTRIEALEAK